jgi:hypothetical protein
MIYSDYISFDCFLYLFQVSFSKMYERKNLVELNQFANFVNYSVANKGATTTWG